MKDSVKKCRHRAYYGHTEMERMYCIECECWTLVTDGIKLCCDGIVLQELDANKVEYICPPEGKRRKLSKKMRDKILELQSNRCIYCGIRFGKQYWYKDKKRIAKVEFDHFSPFALGYDNSICNYVASCKMCNLLKGSMVFDSYELASEYIIQERVKRGLEVYIE